MPARAATRNDAAAEFESLDVSQRNSLETFAAVTNRDPTSRASLEALRDADWNLESEREGLIVTPVQTAISRVYDGTAAYPPASSRTPDEADEQDDLDDLNDPLLSHTSPGSRRRTQTGGLGTGAIGLYYLRQAIPLAILAYPVALLYNFGAAIVVFLARLFRLRPSSTASFRPRNPFAGAARPRTTASPAAAAENFVRSVERVTSLSRRASAAVGTASSSSVAAAAGPYSSSGPLRRHPGTSANRSGTGPRIPDFFIGSYDEALRFARDDMRILMVILTSEEHERDERLKREVLVSEVLNELVEEERIVVWGGDVSDRDAYQGKAAVSRDTLSFISLPFVAFIALQPSGPPGVVSNPATASTISPRMRLVSRFEHLPSTPLTATTLHAHVQTAVLPRAKPYLARLAAQKAQREADRWAREDAERRVAENARRDEEKVLAVRRREEDRVRAERDRVEREERDRLQREEMEREAEQARRWRVWRRGEFEQKGEAASTEEGAVRVAVRLGNGQRVMRTFAGRESTEEVYAWTECELERQTDRAQEVHASAGRAPPADYHQRYHFRLATTFPRQVIPLPSHLASPSTTHLDDQGGLVDGPVTIAEAFRGLGKTVNLVVDGLETRRRLSMTSREEDSEEEEEED
ncbi:hypothetical protein BMF94_0923 [Rhodotorula taiwanensis]|uniref:UBX domain-containing protein n=1 Tax=Rhodotorula taiwanensis TaxID=741276 RepID=A0A2S5BGF4_9BASI|nr:hypothetical protein BMF94_0923 [Rhodotorula taiwanensis]